MSFHEICAKDFENSVFHTIAKEWMLITAEKQMDGKPVANTMTASWGRSGTSLEQKCRICLYPPTKIHQRIC